MAGRRHSTAPRGQLSAIADAAAFRRAIHSTGDLGRAINSHRSRIVPDAIPTIVQSLGSTSIYRNILAPNAFPQTYDRIKPGRFPPKADGPIEALWTASTLALFVDELSDFVRLRDSFHDALTSGDYAGAEARLVDIESKLGLSMWSISARTTLLQLQSGTPRQKEYLGSVLDTQGISPFVAFLSFFASFRAEPNVSVVEVSRELLQMDEGFESSRRWNQYWQFALAVMPLQEGRCEHHEICDFYGCPLDPFAFGGSPCSRPGAGVIRCNSDRELPGLCRQSDEPGPDGDRVQFSGSAMEPRPGVTHDLVQGGVRGRPWPGR